MHFNILATTALLASLTMAAPTSDESSHLEKRKARPDIQVKAYTDDSCESATGSWFDNKPECINLDNFSVDVLSINAEVNGAILNDNNCGWNVYAYTDLDCEGSGPEGWGRLLEGSCRHWAGLPRKPIKSIGIYEYGPCT